MTALPNPVPITVAIPADEIRVWRAPLAMRVTVSLLWGLLIVGGLVAMVASLADLGWSALTGLPILLALVAVALVVIRYCLMAKMTAGPNGVTVRRGRRTVTVPWASVETCTCGYYGLTIICTNGQVVRAAWPQKANISTWMHRTTAGDRAAAYLMQRASQYR